MSVRGLRRCGERAVVLDADGDGGPAALAAAVTGVADRESVTLVDVVPGAATVLVVAATAADLAMFIRVLPAVATSVAASMAGSAAAEGSAPVEIAVRYDGPDLASVAENTGLSVDEVVRLHGAVTYRAAFTGFAPGFAYLVGLDGRLRMPRRNSPRPFVPAGSVAIADVYTAVYPRATPGGWHLIGSTDAVMFDPTRADPALLSPGTRVRLVRQPGPLP